MPHRSLVRLLALLTLLYGAAPAPALAQASCDTPLRQILETVRRQYDLPALGGVIATSTGVVVADAVGRRDYHRPVAVTANDQFHLGSCTKSMTASLLAMLVDEGKLRWEDTLAGLYPELAASMHPSLRGVTVTQLLAHQGGVEDLYPPNIEQGLEANLPGQRMRVLQAAVTRPAAYTPGTRYLYSNLGYVIAGAIAERAARAGSGGDWETLIRTRLFEPLGMSTAGLGPMGRQGALDQPLQHVVQNGQHLALYADNGPILNSAGRVHCSLGDWGKYLSWHLQGALGRGRLLSPEGFRRLHSPDFGNYGAGWGFFVTGWSSGRGFWHNGSNTMSYAQSWVVPGRDFAVAVATNQGNGGGPEACDEAGNALIQYTLIGG